MKKAFVFFAALVCAIELSAQGNEPICFTSNIDGSTIKLVNNWSSEDYTFTYSTDGTNWNEITIEHKNSSDAFTLNTNEKIYFRNTTPNINNIGSTSSEDGLYFSITGDVSASGNVMSMITLGTMNDNSSCFGRLFYNCPGLTSASDLQLPASTLTKDCYQSMFSGCTSLTSAPKLPATTLAENCYQSMFSGCSSLTTAPELPATTLETACYNGMFSGCTSLTTAPELPATQTTTNCYTNMFKDCKNLNKISIGLTSWTSSNLNNWLSGVSATGNYMPLNEQEATNYTTFFPEGWTEIPTHTHNFEFSKWLWADDFSSCSAILVCTDDESHADTLAVEITSDTTNATCTQSGRIIYYVAIDFNGQKHYDRKEKILAPSCNYDMLLNLIEGTYCLSYYQGDKETEPTKDLFFDFYGTDSIVLGYFGKTEYTKIKTNALTDIHQKNDKIYLTYNENTTFTFTLGEDGTAEKLTVKNEAEDQLYICTKTIVENITIEDIWDIIKGSYITEDGTVISLIPMTNFETGKDTPSFMWVNQFANTDGMNNVDSYYTFSETNPRISKIGDNYTFSNKIWNNKYFVVQIQNNVAVSLTEFTSKGNIVYHPITYSNVLDKIKNAYYFESKNGESEIEKLEDFYVEFSNDDYIYMGNDEINHKTPISDIEKIYTTSNLIKFDFKDGNSFSFAIPNDTIKNVTLTDTASNKIVFSKLSVWDMIASEYQCGEETALLTIVDGVESLVVNDETTPLTNLIIRKSGEDIEFYSAENRDDAVLRIIVRNNVVQRLHIKGNDNIFINTNTAVDTIADNTISVYVCNNEIIVSGLDNDESVAIYNVTGKLIAKQQQTTNTASYAIPCKGIYFVKIGNKTNTVICD